MKRQCVKDVIFVAYRIHNMPIQLDIFFHFISKYSYTYTIFVMCKWIQATHYSLWSYVTNQFRLYQDFHYTKLVQFFHIVSNDLFAYAVFHPSIKKKNSKQRFTFDDQLTIHTIVRSIQITVIPIRSWILYANPINEPSLK